ncbi:MAG: hypothetical protein QOG64_2566 [Acidimicrobiaceae bacterium]|nr:hypothetical protein [Acidimicrobiaceae bacterium]
MLAGTRTAEQVVLRHDEGLDLDLRLGTRATALDLRARELTLDDGERLAFDGLVLATGAAPRMLPGTPKLDGIHVLRTLDDCLALRQAFESQPHVVVIGAGFIGSEVASTARQLGLPATVLEALPVPLERAIGAEMGMICAALHGRAGTDLRLGVGVSGFLGTQKVEAVLLVDGSRIEAEVVVVGVGVAPATEWLAGSGLTIDNGVVCDDRCRAIGGDGRVVAAGDVARWHNPRFGGDMRVEHWTNAVEMGQAAAHSLLHGDAAPPFAPVPYFWSDQYGKKIQYVGHAGPGDEVRVVEGSVDDGKFVAAYHRAGRLTGALILGWPARMVAYQTMIAEGAPLP